MENIIVQYVVLCIAKRAKQSPSASSMAVVSGALTPAKRSRNSLGDLLCSMLSASALGGCTVASDGRGSMGGCRGSGRWNLDDSPG